MNQNSKGEGIVKGSFYMILALGITGFSLFLFQILAARKIGKEEFGKLSIFYSLFFLLADFFSSGFRDFSSVELSKIFDKEKLKDFLKKYFSSFIFYSIAFYTLIFLLSPLFLKKFFDKNFVNFFLFSLCFLFMFSTIFLRGALLGFRKISYVAISNLSFGILILISGLYFYLRESKLIHFEISYLISVFLTFPLTLYLLKRLTPFYLSFNFKEIILPKNPLMMSSVNSILESYFYIGIILMKIKNAPYGDIGTLSAILTFFLGIKTLFTGIFIPLLPNLSYVLSLEKKEKFYKYIKLTGFLIILTLLLLLILSFTILPSLWQIFFGKGYKFQKIDFVLISIIISIYLMIRLLSRAFFAIKEINYIFFTIIIFLILLSLVFFLLPLKPLISIEISFLFSSFIVFFLLYLRLKNFSFKISSGE
ncbi:MAG: hypothetical protein ABIM77_02775 [candidate division WOR-3 bacterium]